jgi:3-dehydroquinate synthase
LLSAVDSSVGGKTGVNHPRAKNMIGSFYQPIGVFIDTATLETLPDREYRAGLAEVVKYGVILDAEFLSYLENHVQDINSRKPDVLRHIIGQSCKLKADVVEEDEFETKGLRAALNYGHTFGHAFEALAGYGELLHGEAVAIGMVHASRLAERRGLIDSSLTERQIALLHALHLPTTLPGSLTISTDDVLSRMRLDKKSVAGSLRFILPIKAGTVKMYSDVPESDVRAVLETCR